jgi:hypothetical protein
MPNFKKTRGNQFDFGSKKLTEGNIKKTGWGVNAENTGDTSFTISGGEKTPDWKGGEAKKGELEAFLRTSSGKSRFGESLAGGDPYAKPPSSDVFTTQPPPEEDVVPSSFQMKYQGKHSAFPFKSPLKQDTKMLKGTTIFGKTIPEIKQKAKKIVSSFPIPRLRKAIGTGFKK